MPSGILRCPKCQNLAMGSYSYYDSIKLGNEHWFFYNLVPEPQKWKCWALLHLFGKEPVHWYDPCDCCFNPCHYTPTVVTTINGDVVDVHKDFCCGMCCCIIFFCVCYLIYFMYVTIFVWYDIYYYFCRKRKNEKSIFIGNTEVTKPLESNYWADVKPNLYTENFWCDNYPSLFRCTKCNYSGKSFREFLDVNQPTSNLQNDTTNVEINNN